MTAETGSGQTFEFGATELTHIRQIDVINEGTIISETVSDGVQQLTIGTGWRFRVTWLAPNTASHTLEGAIKASTEATLDATAGHTRYTATTCRSNGFTKSSPSAAMITYTAEFVIDDDPTLAAPA